MKSNAQGSTRRRRLSVPQMLLIAFPLAFFVVLLFPHSVRAQSILLRSDPGQNVILPAAPAQIHLWFSKNLNPAFSTAYVINAADSATVTPDHGVSHVDTGNARVSPSDPTEIDVSLKSNLPAAVYAVVYRVQSSVDAQVFYGSFLFKVETANGTIPIFSGTVQLQNIFGASANTGNQLDGSTFFSAIMVTFVDLAAIFWMGAQLWLTFVVSLLKPDEQEQRTIAQRMQRRFERRFSWSALLLFLLANVGVLIGQALMLTGGHLSQSLVPVTLLAFISQGQFGRYWIMREVVAVLALLLAGVCVCVRRLPSWVDECLSWVNLILGLALLATITLSSQAATASSSIVVYTVLVAFLHMLALSLWIGGMLYIAMIYLPTLKDQAVLQQTQSLLTILPYYTPLAATGALTLVLSGLFAATTSMDTWGQLTGTVYGRVLIVDGLLVAALLFSGAQHMLSLRPRLAKDFHAYRLALQTAQSPTADSVVDDEEQSVPLHVKQLEERVVQQTKRLRSGMGWEPLLGVAVLLCAGLLAVFAGTLLSPPAQSSAQPPAKPFTTTVMTQDKGYRVTLTINPDHFGTNTCTVSVRKSNGAFIPPTSLRVTLDTTMLTMAMGTESWDLQANSQGQFSGSVDLEMGGSWQMGIDVHTVDGALHTATVDFATHS